MFPAVKIMEIIPPFTEQRDSFPSNKIIWILSEISEIMYATK